MTNEDKGQKESCEHGWELNSYSQADDGLPVSVTLFCPFCDARWESDNSLTARETALVEALKEIKNFTPSKNSPLDPYIQIAEATKHIARMALAALEGGK